MHWDFTNAIANAYTSLLTIKNNLVVGFVCCILKQNRIGRCKYEDLMNLNVVEDIQSFSLHDFFQLPIFHVLLQKAGKINVN